MMPDTLNNEILEELRALRSALASLSRGALGFHDFEPRARFVYVKHDPGSSLWYFWDHDSSAKETIEHNALTGLVTNLTVYDKVDRDGPKPKLQLNIEADARYVVQCGLDTTFATGLLQGLSTLSPSDLARPLTLQVSGNDVTAHRPVVFCTLYQDGKRIWFEESSKDNAQLVAELRRRFNFPEVRGENASQRGSAGFESRGQDDTRNLDNINGEEEPHVPRVPPGEPQVLDDFDPFDDPEELPPGEELTWEPPVTRDMNVYKTEVGRIAKQLEHVPKSQWRDFFAWLSEVSEPYSPAAGARARRAAPGGAVKDFEAEQFEALLAHVGHFEGDDFVLDGAALKVWEERFRALG